MVLIDALEKNGISVKKDEPLCNHTTFKVGGPADLFIFAHNIDELKTVVELLKLCKTDYMIIGRGSNIIFRDDGYNGAVISLCGDFQKVLTDDTEITAGAGATLANLTLSAADASLSGLEFAYGIPGSVGGAVYMNAGAYGGEIKDAVKSVIVLGTDGIVREFSGEDCRFSYRKSRFSDNEDIILFTVFALEKKDKKEIINKMNELLEKRRDKQPLDYPSAGSTFKRPEGYFAAALIEECGLKGVSVGGAEVSRKHSGFIINKENATACDIIGLIEKVQNTVFEKKGVKLECEVKILGGRE